MARFTLLTKASNIRVSFDERLVVAGSSDEFRWETDDSYYSATEVKPWPNEGRWPSELQWLIEFNGQTPWQRYADFRANCGLPASTRISNMDEWWRNAFGYMLMYEPGRIEIYFHGQPGLEQMLLSSYAGQSDLSIYSDEISFADRDDAPAPTAASFWSGEPAFLGHRPVFSLSRSARAIAENSEI